MIAWFVRGKEKGRWAVRAPLWLACLIGKGRDAKDRIVATAVPLLRGKKGRVVHFA